MNVRLTFLIAALSAGAILPASADENARSSATGLGVSDLDQHFQDSSIPLQLAALSPQEMRDTDGAFMPFVYGAAIGAGGYAAHHLAFGQPLTWQGAAYAAGVGAVTGGVGGVLIRASGGGIAGNIAWRPNMWSTNFGAGQYSNAQGW